MTDTTAHDQATPQASDEVGRLIERLEQAHSFALGELGDAQVADGTITTKTSWHGGKANGLATALMIAKAARLLSPSSPVGDGEEITGGYDEVFNVPLKVKPWPKPKVAHPDIAAPTGVPYIDSLLDQILDAQQDIRFAGNEGMSQPLLNAATLIDEVETAIRKLVAASHPPEADVRSVPDEMKRLREALEPFAKLGDNKDLFKALLLAVQTAMHERRSPRVDEADAIDAWHWLTTQCLAARATLASSPAPESGREGKLRETLAAAYKVLDRYAFDTFDWQADEGRLARGVLPRLEEFLSADECRSAIAKPAPMERGDLQVGSRLVISGTVVALAATHIDFAPDGTQQETWWVSNDAISAALAPEGK